jgi:hypothetical protein
MESTTKKYPRATLRRIVKAHAGKKVGKSVDPLVFLNCTLFIEEYDGSHEYPGVVWRQQLTERLFF